MTTPGSKRHSRVVPPNPGRSAVLMLVFVAILYGIELVDQFLPPQATLDENGIQPRRIDGLDGILWAPLLHGGWGHLIANTLPLLVLGWLVMAGGMRQFISVTALIWVVGGLGTWLVGTEAAFMGKPVTHLGASGVIFGWLVFLLVRGFFLRNPGQITVSIVLFLYWGSMLWGVLPGQPGVSWEGHLFGALGGLLAAWLVGRVSRPRNITPPNSFS